MYFIISIVSFSYSGIVSALNGQTAKFYKHSDKQKETGDTSTVRIIFW